MFELGPMQKKWIAALRSRDFMQGKHVMCSVSQDGSKRYCCLGVARTLLENPITDADGRFYFIEFEEFGLRSYDGKFGDNNDFPYDCLAAMNDKGGKSFSEIADYIEQNPENVFTHSV